MNTKKKTIHDADLVKLVIYKDGRVVRQAVEEEIIRY
jgi:hypothetical protein